MPLMHAWLFMTHGKPGEAHGSWPGAGPALGTQRRTGPDPDRKRASGSPWPGRPLAMSHEPPLASLGHEAWALSHEKWTINHASMASMVGRWLDDQACIKSKMHRCHLMEIVQGSVFSWSFEWFGGESSGLKGLDMHWVSIGPSSGEICCERNQKHALSWFPDFLRMKVFLINTPWAHYLSWFSTLLVPYECFIFISFAHY